MLLNVVKQKRRSKSPSKKKETLLREIHHRVKNNLQIINSLLNLQFDKIKGEEVHGLLKESQGRIQAMAMIHEHLYQSETLTHINFKEYTKRIIDNIFLSYKAKIKRKL